MPNHHARKQKIRREKRKRKKIENRRIYDLPPNQVYGHESPRRVLQNLGKILALPVTLPKAIFQSIRQLWRDNDDSPLWHLEEDDNVEPTNTLVSTKSTHTESAHQKTSALNSALFLSATAVCLALLTKSAEGAIASTQTQTDSGEICPGFSLIQGNLSNANWIFLAESHHRSHETANCINDLTKDKNHHVVLVERALMGLEVPCSNYRVPEKTGRTCQGWESLEGLSDAVASDPDYEEFFQKYLALFIKEIQSAKRSYAGINDAAIDRIVSDKINELQQQIDAIAKNLEPTENIRNNFSGEIDKSHTVISLLIPKSVFNAILEERRKGKSYKQIFEKGIKPPSAIYPSKCNAIKISKVEESLLRRNKGMMASLQNRKGLFTIIVAGKGHLVYHPELPRGSIDYIRGELNKSADHVILGMS